MARSFPTRPFRTHDLDDSKLIPTPAGASCWQQWLVRQGCVLRPRLFCSVLEMSMANWRDEMEHLGLSLGDGGRSLLDLRFADGIFIFGADYHVIGVLLDKLVENLTAVELQLNVQKTKVLTTQTQPPSRLQTPNGLIISVLDKESSHSLDAC